MSRDEPLILGVSCHYHDAAAALLRNGELVAAAEEERFSRRKHDHAFPARAIDFCLRQAGLHGSELDLVVFYEEPFLKFERVLLTTLGEFPRALRPFVDAMRVWLKEKLWIKSRLATVLGVPASRVTFVEHHVSHAASAFFCSPFADAAILTADGVGEWTTVGSGHATADWETGGRNALELGEEIRFPHSLGLLYSAFTAYLGFEVNEGEYKVMGMAPYGTPRYVDEVLRVVRVADDGSFELDLDYFDFTHSTEQTFGRRFVELFGPARVPETPFSVAGNDAAARANVRFADVAASIQHVLEETLLRIARHAHETTGSANLALAGGVALNASANGRLMRESGFRDIWIQPAAGDSGGALGAALYAHHVLLGRPRRWTMEHTFWGESYDDSDVTEAIERAGARAERFSDPAALVTRVVDLLLLGKVVGWYQGRFEWGPRALGHRSIIADPRREDMKERINAMIKFREPFRPFAPAVPTGDAPSYFDVGGAAAAAPLRFMLAVVPVRSERRDAIPAVDHLGTARIQTVRPEDGLYHDVVRRFGEATGTPVLLNTSFNLRGEPIVASPGDALRTFHASGLDALVMESAVLVK